MILYYSPGACSLVPHIALEEARVEFTPFRVVLAKGEHRTSEYLRINPHSRVPALDVEGQVITENIAILNFLAQRFNAPGSVPLDEALVAARCNELLGWLASTVHIAFAQIWRPERFTEDISVHSAIRDGGYASLAGHFAEIETLAGDQWTVGDRFSAVDSYLLVFYRWGGRIGNDMTAYPRWAGLVERALQREGVQRALVTEGIDSADFVAPR